MLCEKWSLSRQARNAFQSCSYKNSANISFYAKIFAETNHVKACILMCHKMLYTKMVKQKIIELPYVI